MEQQQGADVFFLLVGAILVFAMHGGFAFLEVGTVRHKNQVNALVKILVDFAISTTVYFAIGYTLSYGITFFAAAQTISAGQGYELVKFFFLATFAAAVPAIISGGIAERARFLPQCAATALMVGLAYPLIEGTVWNRNFGLQDHLFASILGAPFKDFAGSIVVHAFGGWAAFAAIRQLGPRIGRYDRSRPMSPPPSSIPWLAMGSWLLCIGWFGFNVMSAQNLRAESGLVAINSLMAMCGGILAALLAGRNDPGFVHNGALAGLVAICAGSDVMHPIGAFLTGAIAGGLFVTMFQVSTNKWRIDDVLGVWALHGLCGLWGGIACGIFGLAALGGMGGVTFQSQLVGSVLGAAFGFVAGTIVYWVVHSAFGLRLSPDEERRGADISIHKISANPEDDVRLGRL
ncbi:ammonium transporter [Hyphomicrobium denitrificans 1NES1]|uniref:Ammonium transporter n=1 Tax=Hyphomicrobium denitrificans 1NES1 TaxID=670307 RepID=N0BGS7_9HYPH|nr:ammonium transporter [Hyphomicrobium denitrificans]AGK59636.1 ammonium transporter [Hyphomicrobium denitrificans 1NES1]